MGRLVKSISKFNHTSHLRCYHDCECVNFALLLVIKMDIIIMFYSKMLSNYHNIIVKKIDSDENFLQLHYLIIYLS